MGAVNDLLGEYEYFGQQTDVINNSSDLSKTLIRILIPIWILCGVCMIANFGFPEDKSIQYFSIILVFSGTTLFVFLSIGLYRLLNKISNKNNFIDLYNIDMLKENNVRIEKVLCSEFLNYELIINNTSPYTIANYNNLFGFFNYQLLLSLEHDENKIYMCTHIDKSDAKTNKKHIEFDVSVAEKINRLCEEFDMDLFDINISFYFNGNLISYKAKIHKNSLEAYPYAYRFTIDSAKLINWQPPLKIINEMSLGRPFEFIESNLP